MSAIIAASHVLELEGAAELSNRRNEFDRELMTLGGDAGFESIPAAEDANLDAASEQTPTGTDQSSASNSS
jgi:hypothetical protein